MGGRCPELPMSVLLQGSIKCILFFMVSPLVGRDAKASRLNFSRRHIVGRLDPWNCFCRIILWDPFYSLGQVVSHIVTDLISTLSGQHESNNLLIGDLALRSTSLESKRMVRYGRGSLRDIPPWPLFKAHIVLLIHFSFRMEKSSGDLR